MGARMAAMITATIVMILRVGAGIIAHMHVIGAIQRMRVRRPPSPVSDDGWVRLFWNDAERRANNDLAEWQREN